MRILAFLAKGVLFVLVLIHFILPFTPANPHPELRIKIASLVLGSLFLTLGIRSLTRPRSNLIAGLVLLLIVYAVSAVSGASPITEGWPIKIMFACLLAAGIVSVHNQTNVPTVT